MNAFWDKVNTGLKKAVDEGWSAVKDSAKIGKHRYNVYNLHRKAEKLFAEVGGLVYDMAKPPYENPLSRPEVLKLIEEIKKVEEEAAAIEEEIARTRKKESPETSDEASPETSADTAEEAPEAGPAEEPGKEPAEPEAAEEGGKKPEKQGG